MMVPPLLLCLGVGSCSCPNFIVVALTDTLRKGNGEGVGVFQFTIPDYSPSVWEIEAGTQEASDMTPTAMSKEK